MAREIRLVRQSSTDTPEITFGRQEGEPHRHVRLEAATVSRRHARLAYDSGVWTLTNLSGTNPTLVNGVPLATDASCALRDGDRIEMGEMAFRFRSR
jgi:pSer/pThr/pTyr-binding forkhead associated (FHA) protein